MAASSTASTQRPRVLLQFNQHKEGSVPTIRTVQGDFESDVAMGRVREDDNAERVDGPTTEEEFEDEDDEDDEVDQLVSSEDESQVKAGMSASAATASKPRVRAPRTSQPPIPLARLEAILDSELGEAMSKEAMFVLSAATDAFIKRLADFGQKRAGGMKRSTVTYHDVAFAVHERHELHFLTETIPQPLGLAEALRLREVKEKYFLEPLLSTPAPPRPFTISVPPQTHTPLSITLPARSISVSASASGSNQPSPRILVKPNLPTLAPSPLPIPLPAAPQSTASPSASASTSKPPAPTKGKRKAKQVNGETGSHANIPASAPIVETHSSTPMSSMTPAPAPVPAPSAKEQPSAPPVMQPRRMSMREPKPRRRPDDMDDPPRPPPAPPTSPIKESANTNASTGPKSRKPRAKRQAKAKADVKPAPSVPTPAVARNGVNHAHPNGHSTMMTRSRRGSSAVVPQVATVEPGSDVGQHQGGGSASLAGSGGALLGEAEAVGKNGVVENLGRTIYTSQHPSDETAPR